jgi:hypothetical protein
VSGSNIRLSYTRIASTHTLNLQVYQPQVSAAAAAAAAAAAMQQSMYVSAFNPYGLMSMPAMGPFGQTNGQAQAYMPAQTAMSCTLHTHYTNSNNSHNG